ncbi:MAG: serine/threonine-protein kinase [Methanophagales archaeon]|nr:serine/threonine-protein kinase [Methanophagales archaeon]
MIWNTGDVIVNRFEITEVLEGGMGIAYVALDHRWKRPFAIKTFKDEFFWGDGPIKRFMKEADTWINLGRHTNIVFANFVMEIEGKPHILLDYIEGGNLAQLVGKVNIFEALDFAIQVCDGMDYAYNKLGVIHRDIKPSNILISELNNRKIYKITDFGLVAILEEAHPDKRMEIFTKQISRGGGTWPYMPPEQFPRKILNHYSFAPSRPMTTRSDIYAFGATLYEATTGRHPFSSVEEIFKAKVVNPKLINSTIPKQLDELIMRCLEKDPEERPRSFKELKDELIEVHRDIFVEKYIKIGKEEELDEKDWLNKGFSYLQLKRNEEALKCFNTILARNPKNEKALCDKGLSLLGLNRVNEAIVYIDDALKINPRDKIILFAKGLCLNELGQYETAIEYFDKGLQIPPEGDLDKVQLLANKSHSLMKLEKYQSALDCINESLRLYPRSPECLIAKGELLTLLGKIHEAIECLDKAISINPQVAKTWYERGCVLHLLGSQDRKVSRFEDAVKCYDKALEIDPVHIDAWMGKGLSLHVLEKDEEAKKCFENVIKNSDDRDEIAKEKVEIAQMWLKELK